MAHISDKSPQAEQDSDELLVVRCRAQDERAFRELVLRWEPRLYYYLRGTAASPPPAKELSAQERKPDKPCHE